MTIQIYMGPGLDPFDCKSSLFSSDTSQVLVLSQNIGGQLQVTGYLNGTEWTEFVYLYAWKVETEFFLDSH